MDRVDYQPIIIQDIVNLHKRDELNLRPWYQRRIVWTPQQQAYLINTIHEQKPVPSIYIRHSIDVTSGKSVREVVDGHLSGRRNHTFLLLALLIFELGQREFVDETSGVGLERPVRPYPVLQG